MKFVIKCKKTGHFFGEPGFGFVPSFREAFVYDTNWFRITRNGTYTHLYDKYGRGCTSRTNFCRLSFVVIPVGDL